MVYSSKDFESLWFLYQAEGLPKNISIEEFCIQPLFRRSLFLHRTESEVLTARKLESVPILNELTYI